MAGNPASTGIRFFTQGGELVKRTFDEIGNSGQRMWRGIATSQEAARPGMRALSAGVTELRNGVEGMVSRAGPAGRILSGFGAAGVVAAAGIGGLVAALWQAKGAMNFAADIGDTAERIKVSTDALQGYRYMVEQTAGTAEQADQALKDFQENFGLARAGNERTLKWFKALGFSQEDLQSIRSAEEMLPLVAEKIKALGSASDQAAIAGKLGITPMLTAIRESGGELDAWIAKAREAGVVMDSEFVKKGKEANDKFDALSRAIDVQLKTAFLDLAPVLTAALGIIVEMAKWIGKFVDGIRSVQNMTQQGLWDRRGSLEWEKQQLVNQYGWQVLMQPASAPPRKEIDAPISYNSPAYAMLHGKDAVTEIYDSERDRARKRFADIRTEQASITAELDRRAAAAKTATGTAGTGKIDVTSNAPPQNKFADDLRKAESALLAVQQAMAVSIEDRLTVELQRLDVARQSERDETADQLKRGELTKAQAAIVDAKQEESYQAQRAAAETKATRERQALNAKYDQDMRDAQTDELKSMQDLALTSKQRLAIELAILEAEREKQRKVLLATFEPGGANASMTAEQKDGELSAFDAETARQRGAAVRKNGEDWMQTGREAVYTSLHDAVRAAFEGNKSFLDAFFGGLAQTFAQKLEDKLADMLFDGIDALLAQIVSQKPGEGSGGESGLTSLWGGLKTSLGFASGGNTPSGTWFRAAEHDTEMMMVGRAGRVFNAGDTAEMLKKAVSGGRPSINLSPVYSPTYHFTGTSSEMAALNDRMDRDRADFADRTVSVVNNAIESRLILGMS